MPQPRRLRAEDLPACMRLKNAAGWNQTASDWLALIHHREGACFGIEMEGGIIATATVFVYQSSPLAWLGMVLTDPEWRGRGLARMLLATCLAWCDEQGIATVKLDATAMGEPLYRGLGFQTETAVERWVREPGPLDAALAQPGLPPEVRPHIPAELLVETAHVDGGWAAGRPGEKAWFFGPCHAGGPDAAQVLARALIAPHAEGLVYWDLLPAHAAARVARNLGFGPARQLLRMYRGAPLPTPADAYALGGFEFG